MQDIVGRCRHLRFWALLGWIAIFVQAENAQQSLSRDEAIDEIVADASMDRMGDKSFWQAVAENLGEDRGEVRGKITQFFDKYLGKIKEALGTKQVFMSRVNVARLEKQMQDALSALYAEGIREAAKNRKALTGTATETKNAATEGGEVQYSIRQTSSGQLYVQADRQVLTGDDPVQWGKQIEDYINNVIRSGEDFVVPTRDGSHFLALTSRSAYKLKDRNLQSIQRNRQKNCRRRRALNRYRKGARQHHAVLRRKYYQIRMFLSSIFLQKSKQRG